MMNSLPEVSQEKDLAGKTVVLRASLNVPLQNGQVINEFRLKQSLQTVEWLSSLGAKVVVVGHIGRDPSETLKPVYEIMSKSLPVIWSEEIVGESVRQKVLNLKNGEVVLLENIRSDVRETKNDDQLARDLASLGDLYVNDAFSDSHREHSSLCAITKYLPSYFGPNFINEYRHLTKAFEPSKPALFILGGAKFETKINLVSRYAKDYDYVFVGGALTNDILKAKGMPVGQSLVSDIDLSQSEIINLPNLLIPIDVVVDGPKGRRTVLPEQVEVEDKILDAGEETIKMLTDYANKSKTILWNGPIGNYEAGFALGTEMLAKTIAKSEAHSIVGGGDTVAVIEEAGLTDQFGFVSSAGGAMLTLLEEGSLVAIDCVLNKNE